MIYSYVALQLALFLLSLSGYFQVKRFLVNHPAITGAADLARFRSLARVNMYIALAYLILAFPGIILSIYLGIYYGLMGSLIVVAANAPHFLFARHLRELEEKARKLECASQLYPDYKMTGEVWFKKALPNF